MSDAGERALEAKNAGEDEPAERLYLEAQGEGDLLAATNLGIMYWELGHVVPARNQFVLAAEAGYGAALWDLGNMYAQIGYVSAAFTAWEECLPDQPEGYQSLLSANAQREQFEAALMWIERGIAAGADLTAARDAVMNVIPQQIAAAPALGLEVAKLLGQAAALSADGGDLETQGALGDLRWQIAERRPLGPGAVDQAFGIVAVANRAGVLRPAGEVIPAKSECWALAADAYGVLLEMLVNEGSDPEDIGEAAMKCSIALQESLTLDPRELSEREEILVDNLINVFTVLEAPMAGFYQELREA